MEKFQGSGLPDAIQGATESRTGSWSFVVTRVVTETEIGT
jgi:hypothetical protein